MDKMEVLSSSFSDNPWVALVFALSHTVGNLAIQLTEDRRAASVV